MYISERLTLAEFAETESHLYIRGNCEASMRKAVRYPGVSIHLNNGIVGFGECTCEAKADGKCAHVACLLYLAEDVSLKQEPKIQKACTSAPQAWGRGSTRELEPAPVYQKSYSKKVLPQDRYESFDPRPKDAPPPDTDRFLRGLQELPAKVPYYLPTNTMWGKLLRFNYKNREPSDERKAVLIEQVFQMLAALAHDVRGHLLNPLSTLSGVHVGGTEDQSESDLWHNLRKIRITGSSFKDFATNPEKMAAAQWTKKPDISHLNAIKWGKENEDTGRRAYEQKTGNIVTCCGLFISKKNPLFAASPDGIVQNRGVMIEIKCPHSLKDCDLESEVTCAFLDKDLLLRRSHGYYYQIQLGMYCTGLKKTDFVV